MWRSIPVTSSATSPMAATSAAMLRVLAISSSSTTPRSTIGGNAVLMLAASPLPVTRPIRAQIDWIAAISGKHSGIVQSMLQAELRAGLRIGGDAGGVVVGDAGDQPRPDPRQRMLLQPSPGPAEPARRLAGFTLCHRPPLLEPQPSRGEA